jgi:hypothetical protein
VLASVIGVICYWGMLSWEEFKATRALIFKFEGLKSCSDEVLDKASNKSAEMGLNKNRMFLIAFLSITTGSLIVLKYGTLCIVSTWCKTKENDDKSPSKMPARSGLDQTRDEEE